MATKDWVNIRILADWLLWRPLYQATYHPAYQTAMMAAVARQWEVHDIVLHFNRGCDGLSIGGTENRPGLIKVRFQGDDRGGEHGGWRGNSVWRARWKGSGSSC